MAVTSVFVTVGTTKFDRLIDTVISDKVLKVLSKKGCRSLVLQVGQGEIIPPTEKFGIQIESFSLKPSITQEISQADLVISHAGAGSCLAVLGENKPLIVVINEDLMDNHQQELADKLEQEEYLFKSNCSNLIDVLENANFRTLKPYVPGNPKVFADYMDRLFGFSS